MKTYNWNLWHGCHKKSEGCKNCYVYRHDEKYGNNTNDVYQTKNFDLPIRRKKDGNYLIPSGSFIWTCFSSDFLLEDTDEWRILAWQMIKERQDCHFLFITKRIERFMVNLPIDWKEGWDNVTVCVTCENQKRTDERLPIFKSLPIKHKQIIAEPLLEAIDFSNYLDETIEQIVVGGESGLKARLCNYNWILQIREICLKNKIDFYFKQTGAYFVKDNILYHIPRYHQSQQAHKANIDYFKK